MRNYQKLFILLFISAALFSCQKDHDLNVSVNESGTFKVTTLDTADNGMANACVEIIALNSGNVVLRDSTGQSGVCTIDPLNQGTYKCRVFAPLDRSEYIINEHFQGIAGQTETLELHPMQNAGKATIKVIDSENDTAFANVKVAVRPYLRIGMNEENSFEKIMKDAFYLSKTDANGIVVFEKIPVTGSKPRPRFYSIVTYIDEEHYNPASGGFRVHKGEHTKDTVYSYL